jgi:hypothetical protein
VKHVIASLMVVVGALLAACTEEAQPLPVAGLSGTYDLVLVKDLLFVTSSDRDELRVLELKEKQEERGYIRAPNPLEPLSIPVLPRPQALTRDVLYTVEGDQDAGPYLYVRSNGSTEISVVAAGREYLRELRRLATNQLSASLPTPSTGPVTAFAARGPGEEGVSTLYYATQEATGARLWLVRLPGPEALTPDTPLVAESLDVALPPNVAVSSLLVLPQAGQLAVATRGAAGALGKSYKVNLTAKTLQELNFGGAQVLQLETHGKTQYQVDEESPLTTVEAGARIFGILDPSSCGVESQCTGVLAVNSDTGMVAQDITGRPMLPIGSGSALPMGLSLSTDTKLQGVSGRLALLGIVPLSNGQILFFDGLSLQPFDLDPAATSYSVAFVNTRGESQASEGTLSVKVTEGMTRTEAYALVFQGILPEMDFLPRGTEEGKPDFVVSAAPVSGQGQLVQPGDLIVLLPEGGGGQPCGTDLVVSTVQPTSDADKFTLSTNTLIPEACAGYTRFQVRAAGSQPLVLSSSTEAYLGRLGAGDTYLRTGSYFFHPKKDDTDTTEEDVSITVSRLEQNLLRGERYVVSTLSHYFPYVFTVDTAIDAALRFFQLPGSVVQAQMGSTDYAYIAYPSADGVLEVNLALVVGGVPNSRALLPYR